MKIPALLTALILCQSARAETVSSLDLPAIDREVAVSHNQWLASSFMAGPDAQTMRVEEISIRVACLWPNANPFIAITGSDGGKPDLNDVRVVTAFDDELVARARDFAGGAEKADFHRRGV